MMSLQRHMTSLLLVVDLKGNIFGRAIYRLSLIVIAFILAKLWGGGGGGIRPPPIPRPRRQKQPGLDRFKLYFPVQF